MTDHTPTVPGSRRPAEWGRLTWLRDWAARRLAGAMSASPERPHFACAIVKVDHIGDFVLATGAIARLLAHFGETSCVLVISPQAAALAAREFPRTPRVVLPADVQRLWREFAPQRAAWRRQLEALSCDHVVCLRHQRSIYRDFVLRALPARRRWWLDHAPFGDRPVLNLPPPAECYPANGTAPTELAAHARLLSAVTGTAVAPDEIAPRLTPLSTVSVSDTGIVIAPLAQHRLRDLPAALVWSALASDPSSATAQIELLGSAEQRKRLEDFRACAPRDWQARVAVRAGEATDTWLNRVAQASLVISAESATAHLAAAFDRPLIAVIGGGHPDLFGPWQRSPRQRWLRHRTACYGCDWQCPYPEPTCIVGVSREEFSRAIAEARTHPA